MALQWTSAFHEVIFTYANNIHTVEGGTHLSGLRSALTRTINFYAQKNNLFKNKEMRLEGEDAREGLVAIISVKLPEPQFEGQTKTKLGNSEVEGMVAALVNEKLGEYLEENPSDARKIINARDRGRHRARGGAQGQGPGAAQGRAGFGLAARQARRLPGARPRAQRTVHRRGRFGRRLGQAGPRPPHPGDPAAARQNPQRRARADRKDALLAGIAHADHGARDGRGGPKKTSSKLRYHTVVIMTDADVDGSHIRTLLLTLFFRQFIEIIEGGYLYVAQPPLFRAKKGKQERYLKDEIALEDYLTDLGAEALTLPGRQRQGDARTAWRAAQDDGAQGAASRADVRGTRAALQGTADRRGAGASRRRQAGE